MKNVLAKFLLCMVAVLGAFFLERVFAALLGPKMLVPPLILLAVAASFPVLPLPWRLWIAGMTGLIIDAFGYTPFGATVIALLVTALAAEAIRSIVAVRSYGWGHATVSVGLALSVLALRPIAGAAIRYIARALA